MGIIEYLWDKKIYIVAAFLSNLAAGIFLKIIGIREIFILLLIVLWLIPFVIAFLIKYFEKDKYYKKVFQCMEQLESKSLLAEIIDRPWFLEGQYFYDMLKESEKYMNDVLAQREKSEKEYKEFVELWVHEIKTPITTLELQIHQIEDFKEKRKLENEVRSINRLVEKVLYYARSSFVEKDFLIEKISLKEMVEETIKENARELIQSGVQVEMKELDQRVYADKKWMKFILSQIIMNSIKYKNQDAKIIFQGKKDKEWVTLYVKDNGIGINNEDIERIFEKGFTGKNGRNTKKSTGMGLYLCKKLCNRMNLSIAAESKEGEGCSMMIQFPVGSFIGEK